jgi:hypothetical protein
MASQDNINVFAPDLLDKAVTGYEENVPLVAQIAAGFTPPGMAADVAAATKYGRDAFRDFSQGRLGEGGANLGIAALSGLGAIPLIGDLARGPKSILKQMVKADTPTGGISSLPKDPRYGLTRHQEDLFTGNPVADANKMYDRALRIGPEFKTQMDDIAKEFNLETTLPEFGIRIDGDTLLPVGTTKKIPRMVEKARNKYQGDMSQITDPIRTRIVVNNPAEEEAVAKLIGQRYDVFDKGRDIKPGTGFVDRKINLKFTGSNGEPLVAEVGIITAPMWRAGDQAHKKYEKFRSLFPEGMPTDPTELGKINRSIRLEGEQLQEEMAVIFKNAKDQIDPSFYDLVKKFASGGYVTSGSTGRSLPITPNLFSNDVLDIFSPSTKKSATWPGVATVQSSLPGDIKYPKSASPTGSNTAGPSSHVKNNVSIRPSLQKFTNNYNPNDVNVFGVE